MLNLAGAAAAPTEQPVSDSDSEDEEAEAGVREGRGDAGRASRRGTRHLGAVELGARGNGASERGGSEGRMDEGERLALLREAVRRDGGAELVAEGGGVDSGQDLFWALAQALQVPMLRPPSAPAPPRAPISAPPLCFHAPSHLSIARSSGLLALSSLRACGSRLVCASLSPPLLLEEGRWL